MDNVSADNAVYLDVTQLAAPDSPLTPISFGNVHAAGSTVTLPLSVTNATTGSFVDSLGAAWGTAPAGYAVSGAVSGLGAGGTDSRA